MSVEIAAVLLLVVFVVLLVAGRGQIAKGANVQVANGAVMLVVAAVVGVLAFGAIVSLDVW
jgi:uncharacterized membrane protein YcaP (DUF421 family)